MARSGSMAAPAVLILEEVTEHIKNVFESFKLPDFCLDQH